MEKESKEKLIEMTAIMKIVDQLNMMSGKVNTLMENMRDMTTVVETQEKRLNLASERIEKIEKEASLPKEDIKFIG